MIALVLLTNVQIPFFDLRMSNYAFFFAYYYFIDSCRHARLCTSLLWLNLGTSPLPLTRVHVYTQYTIEHTRVHSGLPYGPEALFDYLLQICSVFFPSFFLLSIDVSRTFQPHPSWLSRNTRRGELTQKTGQGAKSSAKSWKLWGQKKGQDENWWKYRDYKGKFF